MSTTEVSTLKSTQTAEIRPVDLKLEVVVVPVSDADRAKQFYASLGWREDADFVVSEGYRVLQFTPRGSQATLFSAMRAGANGYLLKGADRADIARAVLSVSQGEAVYGALVARRISDFFTGAHKSYAAQVFPELTDREREVLDLLSAGHGNHEIARRLVLSEKTVRNHVSAILTKLQVSDRASAVVKARDAGLGRD